MFRETWNRGFFLRESWNTRFICRETPSFLCVKHIAICPTTTFVVATNFMCMNYENNRIDSTVHHILESCIIGIQAVLTWFLVSPIYPNVSLQAGVPSRQVLRFFVRPCPDLLNWKHPKTWIFSFTVNLSWHTSTDWTISRHDSSASDLNAAIFSMHFKQ